ncbi:MAG: PEP-utilizing enzyme [Nanoarchaeota archaeon]
MNKKTDFSFLKGRHASPEGGRKCYGYVNYLLMRMYAEPHNKWNLDTLPACGISKDHTVKWFFLIKDADIFNYYFDRFLAKPSLLKELEDFIEETSTSFLKDIENKNLEELNKKQLAQLASSYYTHFKTLARAAGVLRWLDRSIVSRLKSISEKYNLGSEGVSILSTSARNTFSTQERLALLNLALKSKRLKEKKIEDEIKIIHDKFAWSVIGYYNEKPRTVQDYSNELELLVNSKPEIILREIEDKNQRELAQRASILKSLNKEEKIIANISADATYLKDYYKSSISHMSYAMEPIFIEISKRTKTNIDLVKDLFPEECASLINENNMPKNINGRIKNHICLASLDKYYILTDKEAQEFEEKFIKIEGLDKKEFKGRVACKGFVTGKAKVILGTDDFHKFNKGDILVAANTSPDFVPIMKKASAIIAEDGGITSHTSVVSREMGVPCIVGINNATKIFKDNELIEVDANKGVVKKL